MPVYQCPCLMSDHYSNTKHEPCNGLLMCSNHRILFDGYTFFIRFFPDVSLICLCFKSSIHNLQIQKFVFINYADEPSLSKFHGKAVALDIKDHHALFPSLFIIHEMRIQGFHPPFHPCPIIPLGKTGSYRTAYLITS